jgi:hypothetical protein
VTRALIVAPFAVIGFVLTLVTGLTGAGIITPGTTCITASDPALVSDTQDARTRHGHDDPAASARCLDGAGDRRFPALNLPTGAGPDTDGNWPPERCSITPDFTTGYGCLTPRTAAVATRLHAAGYRLSCWDAHQRNPDSDHPRGKACDVTFGPSGELPSPSQKAAGDALVSQLHSAASDLGVNYLIWYGHIWSTGRSTEGWRHYTGGDIYDPTSITGGHYDHVHISVY